MKIAIVASVLIAGISATQAQGYDYNAQMNEFNSTWSNPPRHTLI